MTTIATPKAYVERLSAPQARNQIEELLALAGMSREELQQRGEHYDLDAEQRGLLSEIEGLEWLLSRRR